MKKLHIFLDGPYKWGRGWTASRETYVEFDEISKNILKLLGFEFVKNEYDVPEGIIPGTELKAYLHPLEFVIAIGDKSTESIITIVMDQLPDYVKIHEVQLRKPIDGDPANTSFETLSH